MLSAIVGRRGLRVFTYEAVPREQLRGIAAAGNFASSGVKNAAVALRFDPGPHAARLAGRFAPLSLYLDGPPKARTESRPLSEFIVKEP